MTSKTMSKEGEEGWNISNDDGRYVGCAGAEGLLPSICRGQADHCPEDRSYLKRMQVLDIADLPL